MSLSTSFQLLRLSCRSIYPTRQCPPLYFQTIGLKTLEEKVGLPPRPKKPLTPYFRFMKEMRSKVASENPNAKAFEIVKILASKWEVLDEERKKQWQEDFKKDQLAYFQTRTKYDSKVTDEQREQIKQFKQEIADAKQKRAMRKRIRELGKPKKPASAFLRFLAHERTATPQGENQKYRDWQKKTVEKWMRLPDSEKETYANEAKKEIEIYKINTAKWEEKMIRLGHIDVVRSDSLIDPPETKSSSTKGQKVKKSE